MNDYELSKENEKIIIDYFNEIAIRNTMLWFSNVLQLPTLEEVKIDINLK